MKKAMLVFIPAQGLGHIMSTVELAKHLLDANNHLEITILILKAPNDTNIKNYMKNLSTTHSRLRLVDLPSSTLAEPPLRSTTPRPLEALIFDFMTSQLTNVRDMVFHLISEQSTNDSRVVGIVVDMFCTTFIDVANEFGLPSYVFCTSGACCLAVFSHFASLFFDLNEDLTQYKDSDVEFTIPGFAKPLPEKVIPTILVDSTVSEIFMEHFKRLKETKGIMVNTFYELESSLIDSLSDGKTPKIYPVGPILKLNENGDNKESSIMEWLDKQPESSVLFLCFGSMGAFDKAQVNEIAFALENSGQRFLWSLRRPASTDGEKTKFIPTDHENPQEVLPKGFLERTKEIGKVIGWAPQTAILGHRAVGGFVSHCGWNSTLESIWFGVPIATWPLFAEQQLNAFQLVKELGVAEAIRIDYKKIFNAEEPAEIVSSHEIEGAIQRLMGEDGASGVRQKVKEMKDKARMALEQGGSSYVAQRQFIEDVFSNIG